MRLKRLLTQSDHLCWRWSRRPPSSCFLEKKKETLKHLQPLIRDWNCPSCHIRISAETLTSRHLDTWWTPSCQTCWTETAERFWGVGSARWIVWRSFLPPACSDPDLLWRFNVKRDQTAQSPDMKSSPADLVSSPAARSIIYSCQQLPERLQDASRLSCCSVFITLMSMKHIIIYQLTVEY